MPLPRGTDPEKGSHMTGTIDRIGAESTAEILEQLIAQGYGCSDECETDTGDECETEGGDDDEA